MSPQLKNDEIESIVKVVTKYKEVEQVILFGSRATGKSKPNSDIDICLKGVQVSSAIQNSISSNLDDLPLPYFFDVLNYDTITSAKLKSHILNYGIDLLRYADATL
jgi:predicted nucleotidyltransferase